MGLYIYKLYLAIYKSKSLPWYPWTKTTRLSRIYPDNLFYLLTFYYSYPSNIMKGCFKSTSSTILCLVQYSFLFDKNSECFLFFYFWMSPWKMKFESFRACLSLITGSAIRWKILKLILDSKIANYWNSHSLFLEIS